MSFFIQLFAKITVFATLFVAIAFTFIPVQAEDPVLPGSDLLCRGGRNCPVIAQPESYDPNRTGVVDVVLNVSRFLTFISAAIAILFLVYGGVLYATDNGDGKNAEKGKKIVINAVIGLILAIVAYTIVALVGRLVQGGLINGGRNI